MSLITSLKGRRILERGAGNNDIDTFSCYTKHLCTIISSNLCVRWRPSPLAHVLFFSTNWPLKRCRACRWVTRWFLTQLRLWVTQFRNDALSPIITPIGTDSDIADLAGVTTYVSPSINRRAFVGAKNFPIFTAEAVLIASAIRAGGLKCPFKTLRRRADSVTCCKWSTQ